MLFPLLFLKGSLIGFLIAAPVGPIGILCIRRTLSGRYLLGLVTGLGAGLADTFYGAVAGFSLASISDFIEEYNVYLRFFGGILLAWLGVRIYIAPPRHNAQEGGAGETLLQGFASAFFLTVSNPVTLLVFAAAFAAVGVSTANDSFSHSLTLVTGVFFGATAWWFSLSTGVQLMHHKLSDTQLSWINRISGILLVGFSIFMLLSLYLG